MNVKDYFENNDGVGVLSTSDSEGRVNSAIFSRPHFLEDYNLAFIMRDRLTHENLRSNPHASYLFKEEGAYQGKRLYLTMTHEEENSELIDKLRRSTREYNENGENLYLVHFHLDGVLPLMGSEG